MTTETDAREKRKTKTHPEPKLGCRDWHQTKRAGRTGAAGLGCAISRPSTASMPISHATNGGEAGGRPRVNGRTGEKRKELDQLAAKRDKIFSTSLELLPVVPPLAVRG
ncbi:hypothetical protein MGYG_00144 [Nannizzia gypsea CBS 118893]|uniref:Uncharacterized protein n=1 Tax=Arthroderma gypseum (strain ATCC MYA-4604 / CBS 118893) TaxID=535722 RepID=E5R372_ARTGP|nr:hypothetical protein MGYG_00144 [Nannizzia gypsea CBS 118893]EFQ97101.1 hypothetical protein MGYG_00144 [Nannizzia gypsea CBS 118893]